MKTLLSQLTKLPSRIAILAVELYQLTLGLVLGGQCRFYPSCSNYAKQALDKYGFIRGSAKSLWRIMRCHPYHPGGIDEP